MKKCPHLDCGWCYDSDSDHHGNGSCVGYDKCDYYKNLLDITEKREYILEKIEDKEG